MGQCEVCGLLQAVAAWAAQPCQSPSHTHTPGAELSEDAFAAVTGPAWSVASIGARASIQLALLQCRDLARAAHSAAAALCLHRRPPECWPYSNAGVGERDALAHIPMPNHLASIQSALAMHASGAQQLKEVVQQQEKQLTTESMSSLQMHAETAVVALIRVHGHSHSTTLAAQALHAELLLHSIPPAAASGTG